MPQVIQRQEDPDYKMMQSLGDGIVDSIYKKQALNQTAEYYKIMAKQADNEVKKLSYQKKADTAASLTKLMEQKDPEQRAMMFKVMHDAGAIDFGDMSDVSSKASEYHKLVGKRTENEQAALEATRAQTMENTAQASKAGQEAEAWKDPAKFINAMRASAMGGESAPAGVDPSGISGVVPGSSSIRTPFGTQDFVDLGAEYSKNRAQQLGTQSVPTLSSKQKDDLTDVDMKRQVLDNMIVPAMKKIAGSSGPIAGRMSDAAANLTGGQANPEFRAYMNQLPSFSLAMYGAISGDNSRLSDQDAIQRAKPFLWQPNEEPWSVGVLKVKRARQYLDIRKKLLQEGMYTVGPDGALVTPLKSIEDYAQKMEMRGKRSSTVKPPIAPGAPKALEEMSREEIEQELQRLQGSGG